MHTIPLVFLAGLLAACGAPGGLSSPAAATIEPYPLNVAATGVLTPAAADATVVAMPVPAVAGPAFVYARGAYQGEVVIATADGAQQRVVSKLDPLGVVRDTSDVHRDTGAILFAAGFADLRFSERGVPAIALVDPNGDSRPGETVMAPRISPDGRTVAYATFGRLPDGDQVDLRLLDLESGADRLLKEHLGQYVGWPRYLQPLGWSADGDLVYLRPVCECGDIPRGLYAADVATGELAPVDGADAVSGEIALAPDGSRVAYATLDIGVDREGDLQRVWPNRLEVVDLATGTIRTVIEPEAGDTYVTAPIWSPDGTRLAYALGDINSPDSIHATDLGDGTNTLLAEVDVEARPGLAPRLWLPGDLLVHTGDAESGTVLWLQDTGNGVWTEVDRATEMFVMGWYR